jgi:hypothetical protein
VHGQIPFEALYRKKHVVHHLRIFICIVYVRNTKPHLKKLEDRGKKMVFVGYEKGTKAYRAYDPVSKKAHITRDVMFDEHAEWDWSAGAVVEAESSTSSDTFTMHWETDVWMPS